MSAPGYMLYSGIGRDIAAAGAGVGDALREVGAMRYKSARDAQDYADRVAYRNYLERRDTQKADATSMRAFARDLQDTSTTQGVGDLLRAYGPTMSGYMPAVPPTSVQAPSIPGFDTSAPASVLSTPGRPGVNPLSPLAGARLAEIAANPPKQGGLTYRGMSFDTPQEYFAFINREARARHLPSGSAAKPPAGADVRAVLDAAAKVSPDGYSRPELTIPAPDYARFYAGARQGTIPLAALPDSVAAVRARQPAPDTTAPGPASSDAGGGHSLWHDLMPWNWFSGPSASGSPRSAAPTRLRGPESGGDRDIAASAALRDTAAQHASEQGYQAPGAWGRILPDWEKKAGPRLNREPSSSPVSGRLRGPKASEPDVGAGGASSDSAALATGITSDDLSRLRSMPRESARLLLEQAGATDEQIQQILGS